MTVKELIKFYTPRFSAGHKTEKSSNGYVYNGNFNNVEQFKGKIIKIEEDI